MISSRSLKYARTLAEVAGESDQGRQVQQELESFAQLLDSHKELRETLVNPALPFQAKRRIVEQVSQEGQIPSIVVNFLLVLMEKAQMESFGDVVKAYQSVMDEMEGIVQADVFSAQELGESEVRRLTEAIGSFTQRQVKLSHHLDESLIGGLRLRIGSTIYDGSVSAQLEAIRHQFSSQ